VHYLFVIVMFCFAVRSRRGQWGRYIIRWGTVWGEWEGLESYWWGGSRVKPAGWWD